MDAPGPSGRHAGAGGEGRRRAGEARASLAGGGSTRRESTRLPSWLRRRSSTKTAQVREMSLGVVPLGGTKARRGPEEARGEPEKA